jgi:hypothetical protein
MEISQIGYPCPGEHAQSVVLSKGVVGTQALTSTGNEEIRSRG